jgi:ABC-type sugar transport system ATPase subunit
MEPVLRATGIYKSFGKSQVLKNVNFDIRPGEVHALIGENGAGKSTLLKILFGIYAQEQGNSVIEIDGKPVVFHSPKDAIGYGITMIHQEPLVFKDLSVLENLFTGYFASNIIDWKKMEKQARDIVSELAFSVPLNQKMNRLSVAEQQLTEIGAALVSNARIIFMDEPTASLTPDEVDNLLLIIEKLKKSGKSIVYISHRLDEIKRIADRITVLRDGALVGSYANEELTTNDMIRLMLGHELVITRKKNKNSGGKSFFQAEHIGIPGIFSDVSFSIGRGEILGIAGLMGSGRTEVARGLFGITPIKQGRILIDGVPVKIGSPEEAMHHGIAMIPEDRQALGLFLRQTITFNSTFAIPRAITNHFGMLMKDREDTISTEGCAVLQTKYSSLGQLVGELSGGNQQKVSLAKWVIKNPDIFILDEPTRGIDIGAKEEVYRIIERLAGEGKCIIMISSELAEILTLSDKVLVMYEGRQSAELADEDLNEVNILSAAHDVVHGISK